MFVYVLKSTVDQNRYVGMSIDPDRRLAEHNQGFVRSTCRKRPWRRVLLEKYENRTVARVREKYLKSAAGRRFRMTLR